MALSSGGIAWYDGEGDQTDSINNNDLDTYGGTYESGIVGQCFAIDDYGLKNHDGSFSLGDSDFTFGFWWKPDSISTTTYLCAKGGTGSTSREFDIYFEADSSNNKFVFRNPSTGVSIRASTLEAGTWICIVFRYDASADSLSLHTRRTNEGSWSTGSTSLSGGMSGDSGDADFTLGGRTNTFFGGNVEATSNGPIDSWTLYNRRWTDTERDEFWNGGSGVSYSDVSGGGSNPPDQPTATGATNIQDTQADLNSSTYSEPDGDPHQSSDWQVRLASDTDWTSPVFESLDDTTNLESITATGLSAGTQYEYRVRHTDTDGDSAWSGASSFTTSTTSLPSSDYATASPSAPNADLTDFTLLVDLSTMPQSWWDAVDTTDGTKGRAAKDSGPTEIPADWINFDSTAETGLLAVKWSGTLASAGGDTLRIYPPQSGNTSYAATDTYGQYNAYDADHEIVSPNGGGEDRTGNYTFTENGGVTSGGVSGDLGDGTSYDGNDDLIEVDSSGGAEAQDVTVFASANPDNTSDFARFVTKALTDSNGNITDIPFEFRQEGGSLGFTIYDTGTGTLKKALGPGYSTGTWYRIAGRRDSGVDIDLWRDGTQEATTSESLGALSNAETVKFGGYFREDTGTSSNEFPGDLSLVSLHLTYRSDAWVDLDAQMYDQGAFWSTWSWSDSTGGTSIGALGSQSVEGYDFTEYQQILAPADVTPSNPFDAVITSTLTGQTSNDSFDQHWYYAGTDANGDYIFRLRVRGKHPTLVETHDITTSSTDVPVDDGTGTLTVNSPSASVPTRLKPLTHSGTQWAAKNVDGTLEARALFVQQTEDTDGDGTSESYSTDHHGISYYLNNGQEYANAYDTVMSNRAEGMVWNNMQGQVIEADNGDGSTWSNENPDPTTFDALDDILDALKAKGIDHCMWIWDDADAGRANPDDFTNGMNGAEHKRLQRYVAARLGPRVECDFLMLGFDLQEWATASEVDEWANEYNTLIDYPMMLSARGFAAESTATPHDTGDYSHDFIATNLPVTEYSAEVEDTSSTSDGMSVPFIHTGNTGDTDDIPVYSHLENDVVTQQNGASPGHDGERYYYQRDLGDGITMDEAWTRHFLWRGTMVLQKSATFGDQSTDYPASAKTMFQTWQAFWKDNGRYTLGLTRDNALAPDASSWAVREGDNSRLIVYAEASGSINVDLSGLSGSYTVTSVDTTAAYSELDRGTVSAGGTRTIDPDGSGTSSDWVLVLEAAGAVTLTTNELQHAHTLEQSSVSAVYSLSTNELQQTHALAQSTVSVGYSLTTNELQQAHTLESPTLTVAGLLTPEDVQQGHTVEDTTLAVQWALATDELQQAHTLEQSGASVAYALTPQGLQHLHNLDATTLEAIFGLTPDDLSQAHTIESPTGSSLVVLSVDGMAHPHTLDQVVLGTVGFATTIDVSASPIYETSSETDTLYQITLDASPILE